MIETANAVKTATALNLQFFPALYIWNRVLASDVVVLLTEKRQEGRVRFNRCSIRTSQDAMRRLEIPIVESSAEEDWLVVKPPITWKKDLLREVRRAYRGLPFADAALALVDKCLTAAEGQKLVDYLLTVWLETLDYLGLEKTIVRGASLERRRYASYTDFLIGICRENECNRLYLGIEQMKGLDRPLVAAAKIALAGQDWKAPKAFPERDSILDAIARFPPTKIVEGLR
jgi:hypothetical protein